MDLIKLARPEHWLKNVFVIVPLLFGGLPTWHKAFQSGWAFGCFCLLASGIYGLNDVLDASKDRHHPRKRNRPVASGAVPAFIAVPFSVGLIAASLAPAAAVLPGKFLLVAILYVLNNVLYFLYFKQRVIVDVLIIAIGFVLRLIAGCAAIGIHPSSWILVCGFSLAMLLGFGKRRLEIEELELADNYRVTLLSYSEAKLNLLLGITTSICLLSYMLYTVSPQTVQTHHTENLVYTIPIVTYGIFRYLFKVQEHKHDGPVEILVKDPVFMLTGLIWIVMVAAIRFIPYFQ
jgi:4-hydroxybenzoate polyprenyltransferase